MSYTLRPLSLGKLLDETFDIYRRHFLLFLCLSAIPNIALLLIELGLAPVLKVTPSGKEWPAVLAGIGAAFATLLVSSVVTAATTVAVSDVCLDRPTSIRSSFGRVYDKALKVLAVSFLVNLIVGFGLILCLAPGIYWAGLYGVAVPAVVLENIGVGRSLRRSSELTRDFVGRVVLVYFLTSIFSSLMGGFLTAGVDLVQPWLSRHAGLITKEGLEQVASTLGSVLFDPVSAIGLTLVYYDQRVRKEAFDLEQMMALMGGTVESTQQSALSNQRSAISTQPNPFTTKSTKNTKAEKPNLPCTLCVLWSRFWLSADC